MAIGPIELPITGQKIADTFGFLADGPETNLNSYRGVELRDNRTNLVRFLPTNGAIKYSDFENLYLPFSFPAPTLTINGPSDVTLLDGNSGQFSIVAVIDWNLDQWPDSAPLPASFRRQARWERSDDNGNTWVQVRGFVDLSSFNNQALFASGDLNRDGWLYRAIVTIESLSSDGQVLTRATQISRAATLRVNEIPLESPTINFRGSLQTLRLDVQQNAAGQLVQAASGTMQQSISIILFFDRVRDNEAPPDRRPISSPTFDWSWRVRTTGSGNGTVIASGTVDDLGNRISGDFPGGATTLAGVNTVPGAGVAGGLGGLRFDNLANDAYDGYEFQSRVTISQDASNPVQQLSDSDETNWARLTVNITQDMPTFTSVIANSGSYTDRLSPLADGPTLRLRTANAIGKQVRVRVLNESSPTGGLTRQFDGNFPQFGPQPRSLLRGSFEHTIYSDEDTIAFTGFSNSFNIDPGKLRGLNRFLPTSEPVRVEPVDPSEWNGWTGTTINLTINNDTQQAQSTRTSPVTIMEGQSVSVDVQADDVINDSATFRWAWASGTPIGTGDDDLFPDGTGNYQVDWAGGASAPSAAVGYRGNFTIASNPSPLSLTEGDIEEKGRTSIRVLDQFNNFINQHAVIVNRYVAPPPAPPPLPATVNVSDSALYRNLQARFEPGGAAFLRQINTSNTAFNTSRQRRWNVGPTPSELRPFVVWQVLSSSLNINVVTGSPSGPFTSPSLWGTYTFTDNAPNGTALTVGINQPGSINRQSNPNDIIATATFVVRVSLSNDPGVSETFTVTQSISAPIRTNPPDGGAGGGILD